MHNSSEFKSGYDDNGTSVGVVKPDFSGLDTAADLLRDAAQWGLLEDLLGLVGTKKPGERTDRLRVARDIAYELAGAANRDFAVDLLIAVTGIATFGADSLREYGCKHGCSHEWFRQESEAMRQRLDLPLLN